MLKIAIIIIMDNKKKENCEGIKLFMCISYYYFCKQKRDFKNYNNYY